MDLHRQVKGSLLVVVVIMTVASGVLLWNQIRFEETFRALLATVELESNLLECRRAEKNFFLRTEQIYVEVFQQHAERMALILRSVEPLNEAVGRTISDLVGDLQEYRQIFQEASTLILSRNSTVDYEAPESPLVISARECHDGVAAIRSQTVEEYERLISQSHILSALSVLVAVLLSVLLSGYLTDKITNRVKERGWAP